MKLFPENPAAERAVLYVLCFLSVVLFYAAAAAVIQLIRQKRFRMLFAAVPAAALAYFLEQTVAASERAKGITTFYLYFSDYQTILLFLVLGLAEALLLRSLIVYEKRRITPMSVKEAVDSLPSGMLCYAPGIRTLLVNSAMLSFGSRAIGMEMLSGEALALRLKEGVLLPACNKENYGDEEVLVLPDGSAWKLKEDEILYEKTPVKMLLAFDITEEYEKTLKLKEMRTRAEALGVRLQAVNREIVALTAEQEKLNARIRLHDELGSNLLAIRHFILNGGTAQEKAALMESLRQSVTFLNEGGKLPERDEYALIMKTARDLGLTILVSGDLPQHEPYKHILATAMHECGTNTLRHAHGDRLTIDIKEEDGQMRVLLMNNGKQPDGEVKERGGLALLRSLTEQAGGSMKLLYDPVFALQLTLPKEEENALQSSYR